MVLNTQSYMWMGWIGYLLGPTLRAPYGANNLSNYGNVGNLSDIAIKNLL